jgi:subtilase family serine protease
LAKIPLKILTLALMLPMILAIAPSLVNAQTADWQAQPMYHIKQQATSGTVVYWPSDIKTAYNLPSDGGAGATIAIVDAYNNPNLASDLTYFSTYNNLATPSLIIHKMSTLISNDYNWGMEEALDVQWAHAIAPEAKILVVEARSSSLSDLLSAVNYAKNQPGVVSVSMSWGGNEFSGENSYDNYFTSTTGVQFFASSGDTGGAIIWPSSSTNVISVGGTTLTNANGQWSETAWSGSGGGVSRYEPVSTGQAIANLGYQYKATPDVSYNADPNTGFAVYDTYMPTRGWYVVGGTSAGAPQWAAIQALSQSISSTALYTIYTTPSAYVTDFRDVTTGTSGSYLAGNGYDLCTGIGSPQTDLLHHLKQTSQSPPTQHR